METMTWPFAPLQKGRYGVIFADPDWRFKGYTECSSGVPQRAKVQHYTTTNVRELAKWPVRDLARPDCALFLWSTSAHTQQALWLGRQWGFKFSGKVFCWVKLIKRHDDLPADLPVDDPRRYHMGMGYTSRRNTEDVWLFTRGSPERIHKGIRELIISPLREHSRKPDEAYERAAQLYGGPYCELFSRTYRPGWDVWGDEVGKF